MLTPLLMELARIVVPHGHAVAAPFEHFTCDSVLPLSVLADLVSFSQSQVPWTSHKSPLFEFLSIDEQSAAVGPAAFLRNRPNLPPWLWHGEATLDLFLFEDGHGLGVHDDADLEVSRLVVTISDTRSLADGGAFILVGDHADDLVVYPATQNCGVLFRTHRRHRHAVSVVHGDPLTLLVVQFDSKPETITVDDDAV